MLEAVVSRLMAEHISSEPEAEIFEGETPQTLQGLR